MGEPIVFAEGLRKRFGETQALAGLDLQVAEGTVCGVLGPNGAGKTTAVRVLATLIAPDSGRAVIAGHDVVSQADRVRHLIGLAGQSAALDERITGRENLEMFGRLYHLGPRAARRRANELLERFDLADAGNRLVKTYSGGMRRRLDLIASLVVTPPVLFLDEPTTGLDPRSRNEIWDTVRLLVADGTTVLLTTQYLDEADQLANDIAVVDRGRVIAAGPPEDLKYELGSRVDVVVTDPQSLPTAAQVLGRLTGGNPEIDAGERTVRVAMPGAVRLTLPAIVRELDSAGVIAEDVAVRLPTLDEVFLKLTGRRTDDTPTQTKTISATPDELPETDAEKVRS
ncbi:MAG TPA: ATP-binding cassette domain-containing protein [Pseudonocardiaceae bacterium]